MFGKIVLEIREDLTAENPVAIPEWISDRIS
jgi:hypothetical protein